VSQGCPRNSGFAVVWFSLESGRSSPLLWTKLQKIKMDFTGVNLNEKTVA